MISHHVKSRIHIFWMSSSLLAALALSSAPATACDITFNPGDVATISGGVTAAGPGKTFCFNPGTYRLLRIAPESGDTFIGQPGVIFSGAYLLTASSFTQ